MSYWKDQRVMVTGGEGFLGSHVVEQLRLAGCTRVVVVSHRDFDLSREHDVRRLFEEHRVDVLLHLAGLVGGIAANKARPADFFLQNLLMNAMTLHHAWQAGVRKVVATGAGCGYPEHAPLPLQETRFWDGFPQQESAPYSLAKRMLHVQSMAYWTQHQFPVIVTIPGNIYGPYDNFDLENAHVVPALIRKFVAAVEADQDRLAVWGSGAPTRDFVYAGDVAEGILRAAEVYDRSELVNLASGQETSIRGVVEALQEISGFRGEVIWDAGRPDGQSRRVFDVSRARDGMGWRARTSLRAGLATTMQWYREHRAIARNDCPISSREYAHA
ncbi:MAG: GDP-L-fucose synthase family protein [Isosphaeraceae bacterium]